MSKFPTIPEVTEHQRVANVLMAALQEQLRADSAQLHAFTDALDCIKKVLKYGGAPEVCADTYSFREALAPLMAAYGVELVPHEHTIGKFRIAKIGADLDSMNSCGAQPADAMSIAQSAQQQINEICDIPAKIIVDPSKLTQREWNFPIASR